MHEQRLLRIGRELFLAAFGLPLGEVDTWVIDRLTSMLEERDFYAGQTLLSAGEPVESLLFVHDGGVRLTRRSGLSWTMQGHWVIGGFDVLSDRPVTYSVTALRDFQGMTVPAAAWIELLEDSSQLSRQLVVNMSRTLARLQERIPREPPSSPGVPALLSPPSGGLVLVERLALLLDVGMLRLAGVQALADLAAASRHLFFAPGELVVERGVEPEHLVRIVEGEVVGECAAPEMERRFGPADLVCAEAILGRVAGPWQARATMPTRGLSFPIETLFELMEEHFDLVRSTVVAFGSRREVLLDHLAKQSAPLVLT